MRIRFLLLRNVLLSVLGLAFSIGVASAQSGKDGDVHISDVAEFYAIHKYPDLTAHKAIAVGPGGYWGNYHDANTAAEASKGALNACNGVLRTDKSKKLNSRKCVLFDVDGKRTGRATPIGIPFGTAAEGEDLPWQYGKRWDATGTTKRGTMLLLHGCNSYTLNGWQMAWVNYYRAAGFRVILPNSFADVRESARCGHPGEDGADAQTRIMKLRIAQTLRTIAGIKRKYPAEPLYLHGHSEGVLSPKRLVKRLTASSSRAPPADLAGQRLIGLPKTFRYSSLPAPGTKALLWLKAQRRWLDIVVASPGAAG